MRLGMKALMLAAGTLAATVLINPPAFAQGKVFRWANDGDVNSMDPYARNETFLLSVMQNIYEPVLRRGGDLKLQPALATAWKLKSPTVWEFTLRADVKFSDGTPFTADDVVFSFNRAASGGSNMKGYFVSVKETRKTGPLTVEVETKDPDPLLADKLAGIGIMSKAWSEKNGANDTADLTSGKENFATRNAMGTGPFMLKSREPDVKTVLVRNPNWWDKTTKFNIDTAELNVIPNAATRTAALKSGQVDFVYTVPPADEDSIKKDSNLKVVSGRETRVVYLGFDQERAELLESNIKGKNPFKDQRVRLAFWTAIDTDAIAKTIMRGEAFPVALMVGQGISGYYKDLDVRPKFDVAAAKKLLTDAGYPNGFEVGLDCPNDRYVNDESICKAVVTMLAKIGVKVNLNAQTRQKYFAKILRKPSDFAQGQTSFFMLGWSPGSTYDVADVFQQLIETPNVATKIGGTNPGGYSNKRVDELADLSAKETDPKKREAQVREMEKIHRDEVGHIPLHQQAIVWAMNKKVEVVQRADNIFMLYHVNMK